MAESELRQIKKVLVGTGLSLESVGAIAMAKEIAQRLGAELHAIHVIEPISQAQEEAIPGLAEAHTAHAEEELALFVKSHGLSEGVTLHTARGNAETEILKAIKNLKADLLVVGRYGRGGLKRGRLGSIADRLVRKSPISVLIAHPEYRSGLRNVGVATGFSDECEMLVQRAVHIAEALGKKEVVVMHAYHLPLGYHRVMSEEEATQRLEELAIKRTDKLQQDICAGTDIQLRLIAAQGDARTIVPHLAEEAEVDLLVVGTHGRSISAMFMLPRITESIINNATCSVWAAKRPEWYQGFAEALGELIGV